MFHVRKNGVQLNPILKVHTKIYIYNFISNKSLIYYIYIYTTPLYRRARGTPICISFTASILMSSITNI